MAALLGDARPRRARRRQGPGGPRLSGRELAVALAEEMWLAAKWLLVPLVGMAAAASLVAVAFGSMTPGPVLAAPFRGAVAVAMAGLVGLWLVTRRRHRGGMAHA